MVRRRKETSRTTERLASMSGLFNWDERFLAARGSAALDSRFRTTRRYSRTTPRSSVAESSDFRCEILVSDLVNPLRIGSGSTMTSPRCRTCNNREDLPPRSSAGRGGVISRGISVSSMPPLSVIIISSQELPRERSLTACAKTVRLCNLMRRQPNDSHRKQIGRHMLQYHFPTAMKLPSVRQPCADPPLPVAGETTFPAP